MAIARRSFDDLHWVQVQCSFFLQGVKGRARLQARLLFRQVPHWGRAPSTEPSIGQSQTFDPLVFLFA